MQDTPEPTPPELLETAPDESLEPDFMGLAELAHSIEPQDETDTSDVGPGFFAGAEDHDTSSPSSTSSHMGILIGTSLFLLGVTLISPGVGSGAALGALVLRPARPAPSPADHSPDAKHRRRVKAILLACAAMGVFGSFYMNHFNTNQAFPKNHRLIQALSHFIYPPTPPSPAHP